MRKLKVSDNHRFLVHEDGRPFFYLADTAWEMFHRLDRPSTIKYLHDRAAKGFTAVQAVALAEEDGLRVPNRYGHVPLVDFDPARPNEPYWRHVDWAIDTANALGLFVALLPTWGDKWNNKMNRYGPEVFTPENARVYGRWIGQRYRDREVIWVLGGDRHVETDVHRRIIDAMAAGVREAVGGRHLVTFHPRGGATSATHFHQSPWLDFNMWQTGHSRNRPSYDLIAQDYALTPPKPVIDGEPGYEDHLSDFKLDNGYLDDYDVRKSFYWSLFAGACGYTYGCHPIWMFWNYETHTTKGFFRRPWDEALHLPGSGQVRHGRALIESRPVLARVPDQSMIVSENANGAYHVQATRDAEGRYAFVYCPYWKPLTVDLTKLRGETIAVHWFDPRTGVARRVADVPRKPQEFQPPLGGPDWVLVLDDAAAGFARPGTLD